MFCLVSGKIIHCATKSINELFYNIYTNNAHHPGFRWKFPALPSNNIPMLRFAISPVFFPAFIFFSPKWKFPACSFLRYSSVRPVYLSGETFIRMNSSINWLDPKSECVHACKRKILLKRGKCFSTHQNPTIHIQLRKSGRWERSPLEQTNKRQ